MPCEDDFGIIDVFDYNKDYTCYEPQKYHCISVQDDIINGLIKPLSIIKTYHHTYKRPEFGLDHWGVTIIPPESMLLFFEIVISSKQFKMSEELNDLAVLIRKAIIENKFMIHYGV